MKSIAQIFVGLVSLFIGGFVSLIMMGGIGPCGTDFSIGGTSVAMVIAMVVSLIALVAVPSMPALGASLLSLPLGNACLGLGAAHQWKQSLACLACILAAAATAYLGAKGLQPKKTDGP